MSFSSVHSSLIWDKLHNCLIPDQLTQQASYLRIYGTYTTGNEEVDAMVATNFTTVMIPVSRILEYFEDGIEIQIPSRETLITIHKDIELYLNEWRDRIKYDININIEDNKQLILNLEKLSKYIYNKAKPNELIDNLFIKKQIGIVSPLHRLEEARTENVKTDYEGIGSLVRSKTNKPLGRF